MSYLHKEITTPTPQSEQADPRQQKNWAGGHSFVLDHWGQLERFLVLGSEGGTYYATQRKLTKLNIDSLKQCIAEDGLRTVRLIADFSKRNRAPKSETLMLALASCLAKGDAVARTAVESVFNDVVRIGTHLFQFVGYYTALGKWNRRSRRIVGNWYRNKASLGQLTYQLMKYQHREQWSHRDVLRQCHVDLGDMPAVRWAIGGGTAPRTVVSHRGGDYPVVGQPPEGPLDKSKYVQVREYSGSGAYPEALQAYIHLCEGNVPIRDVCNYITEYGLTHEMVPNEYKSSAEVWHALLAGMPVTATIRNLGQLTAKDVIKPHSEGARTVMGRLTPEAIKKARVHPIQALMAMVTYQQGHGTRGSLSWTPVQPIVDRLEECFYWSFENVVPTGKRIQLALDVSGSMEYGEVAGCPGLTPAMGAAAMAMVTARSESDYEVYGFASQYRDLGITARDRLDEVLAKTSRMTFGATDCSAPMLRATRNKLEVDAFCIFTDSETWTGGMHPHIALQKYRQSSGVPAKLIVVGMEGNPFTISDPSDAGMLDLVGFDASAPSIIADFIRE